MDTNLRKEGASIRVRYAIGYHRQAIYQYYDEKTWIFGKPEFSFILNRLSKYS